MVALGYGWLARVRGLQGTEMRAKPMGAFFYIVLQLLDNPSPGPGRMRKMGAFAIANGSHG